ncbi:hypothetical protein BC351_00465 [Paenibacillus ferrarius]|uniref:Integrase n=1 Tax=Paenibacillus ferrarius TaxID=1469647 RepID=A0A1V4HS24_9BACL|nr:tyrosine-type recombinase/integrase [Paenibacillus ferrarius]OPH61749.1 hypothetical protein BC351_00465 [Paenibacillus ferrarius]
MSAQPNVIGFNSDTVYSDILTFINDERFSEGTRIGYMHDIKLFFSFMNKPSIEQLTHNDLHYENKDIIRYRNFLINDKQHSNATSNRKLASLQSLYSFFKRNRYDTKHGIDTEVFQIDKLKNKSKSYGYLTPEELQAMLQLVLNQVKGYEKYCLIRLATTTSLREDTLLNLTWDNFEKNDQQNCYFVNTVEKKTDKEVSQPISVNLYNELLEIKKLGYFQRYKDNKIFHVTTKTIWEMMSTLKKELNINDKRKIVFHSFRSYGANFILETTGDLVAASNQLNHSNIQTTYQHYINKTKDVQKSAGLLLDEQIDQDAFNKLTFEEIKLLLNDTKNGLRSQLLREATRIIKIREGF